MGKRKERRLAALSNAGRRVKLDLFAEPSGDLGGSSENDKVGGDANWTHHAGLPKSPSSSGLQPQNPLLLLEQYSDDELDEEANASLHHTVTEDSSSDRHDQDELLEEKVRHASTLEDFTTQKDKQQEIKGDSTTGDGLQRLEADDPDEKGTPVSADICNSVDQGSVDGTLHSQLVGDISSGWRIVMHESNQYYYWNTETGETSWEVPAALIQATQLSSDHKTLTSDAYADPMSTNISSLSANLDNPSAASTIDGWLSGSYIHESKELYGNATSKNELVEGYKSESLKDGTSVADIDQSESQSNLTAVTAFQGTGSLFITDHLHDAVTNDEHKVAMDCSSSLMKQCECLLERLKSLKGYGCHTHDQASKYSLELELRLSDIKSLSSYGSSLLPFWNHSEKQLKQLEDSINNDIYQLAVSAQMADDIGVTGNDFSEVKQEPRETCLVPESEVQAKDDSRKSDLSYISMDVRNKSHDHAAEGTVDSVKDDSSLASPVRRLECGTAANEVDRDADLKPEFGAGEDVDMDVDMEVEDGVTSSISAVGDALSGKAIALNDQLIQINSPTDFTSLTSEGVVDVPLPPEEEWVPPPPPDVDQAPPPPPDNEQIPPPPPPDEPSESSSYPILPTFTEAGQPFGYANHYNLTYSTSDFQYYGDTITVQSSNFYGTADGNQLAMSHTSHLYGTVPITYAETSATVMGPPDPAGYYNLQDGSVPLFPVVNSAGSSQLHVGAPCNETLSSDQIRQVDDPAEAIQTSNISVVGHETDGTSVLAPSTVTTVTDSITSKASTTLSAGPATDTAAEPSRTSKSQPKVVRTKKRTVAVAPSLRSNKKVSNLVDKWKAAKEELNENDEDEPGNPYEILEKKRRREIEEWHAKQIASGEAKDNANFQPLGGDWRERVKRRRAQAAKEAKKNPVNDKTQVEVVPAESQQSDLADLGKGLPSGWQAYWDEESKRVYYGNTITSKTTWTKPTK